VELLSRLRSGLFGRAAWNLVDQVVVSLTNSVLTFLVAGSVDDVTFGGFAVAFTVFAVLIGVSLSAVLSAGLLAVPASVVAGCPEGGYSDLAELSSALTLGHLLPSSRLRCRQQADPVDTLWQPESVIGRSGVRPICVWCRRERS